MQSTIIKIAITGPESTGKSSLAQQLAEQYQTHWVPEFARQYLEKLARPYQEEDLLQIAKGQVQWEDEALQGQPKLLFFDTELINIKIWSEYKFGRCHAELIKLVEQRSYDLYLLLDIDTPWEYDPQREHPDKRAYFLEWFQRELQQKEKPVELIHGLGDLRFQNAVRAVNKHLIKS